jgi:magnesium-transporting ATPase (P-type)
MLGGESLLALDCFYIILISMMLMYLSKANQWNSPTTIFDAQHELEQESRTIWYTRFLLFYDYMIFGIVIKKTLYFAHNYNFFNRTDAIILISILSILALGKFLLNRPEESNNTTSTIKK